MFFARDAWSRSLQPFGQRYLSFVVGFAESAFEFFGKLFTLCTVDLGWDVDRVTHELHDPGKWVGDDKLVPGIEPLGGSYRNPVWANGSSGIRR